LDPATPNHQSQVSWRSLPAGAFAATDTVLAHQRIAPPWDEQLAALDARLRLMLHPASQVERVPIGRPPLPHRLVMAPTALRREPVQRPRTRRKHVRSARFPHFRHAFTASATPAGPLTPASPCFSLFSPLGRPGCGGRRSWRESCPAPVSVEGCLGRRLPRQVTKRRRLQAYDGPAGRSSRDPAGVIRPPPSALWPRAG
jgi:hypothetical protein